jgi:hypothetical protein
MATLGDWQRVVKDSLTLRVKVNFAVQINEFSNEACRARHNPQLLSGCGLGDDLDDIVHHPLQQITVA